MSLTYSAHVIKKADDVRGTLTVQYHGHKQTHSNVTLTQARELMDAYPAGQAFGHFEEQHELATASK